MSRRRWVCRTHPDVTVFAEVLETPEQTHDDSARGRGGFDLVSPAQAPSVCHKCNEYYYRDECDVIDD